MLAIPRLLLSSIIPDTSVIVIHGIIFIESLVIFLGNTFTVVVFWKNRDKLKRTSFLLINLAVADLLVGLSQMITTGGIYIPHHIQTNSTLRDDVLKQWIFSCALTLFALCISFLPRAHFD